jgi:hypothetical protein
MALKKYGVQEEVTVNQNTKLYINKQLSNNFHRHDQCDACDKWHKHSELKAIKFFVISINLTLSITKMQPDNFWTSGFPTFILTYQSQHNTKHVHVPLGTANIYA